MRGQDNKKKITFEVGYNDRGQFSRDLKEFHGLTPTAYRGAAARKR
jgi:AraC-like DNA-binding protein